MEELAIPLVIIGAIIWFISAVVNSAKNSVKTSVSNRREELEIKSKYPALDKTKSLEERNQDLIEDNLSKLRQDSWPHYVENKVSDCIKEIALREDFSNIAPKAREWLPVWEKRQGIPVEYIQLKNSLLPKFKERYKEVVAENKVKQEVVEKEYQSKKENETKEFLENKKDLVEKFLEITERKVSIIDDYGDES